MESEATPTEVRWRLGRRGLQLLLLGLVIREAFSFWTGDPYDFEVWIRTGYVAAHGTNPYLSFWGPVPGVSFAYFQQPLPSASYPPFWPGMTGLIFAGWEHFGSGNRFVLYFLLKQPVILADVALAYVLGRIAFQWTKDPGKALQAVGFWSLFPYAIAISGIWGQIDPIEALLLLSVLLAATPVRRTIYEGLGVFVKWLTVIFLPLEVFRLQGRDRLVPVLIVVIPVGLTLAAFAIAGWSVSGIQATTTSQSFGGGGGMNFAQVFSNPQAEADAANVPGLFYALTHLWVPVLILGGWWAYRWARTATPQAELRTLLFLITLFMIVRWGLYEQYLIYLFAPMFLDVLVFRPKRGPLLGLLMAIGTAFFLVNNDLGIWFAAPVSLSSFQFAVHLDQATALGGLRADLLVGISLVMTGALLYLAYVLYRDIPDPFPSGLWNRLRRLSHPKAPAG